VALASILIAVLIRGILGSSLGDRVMYVTFWPAVMFSSWYGGLGPGLATAAASAALIQLLWLQWSDTFMRGFPDFVAQAAFVGLAVLLSILNEQRLRAIEKANLQEHLATQRYGILQQEMKERKELEDDLLRTNRELARSNEDLAGFGHMISHDLQEPLRTMILYSQLVKRRCAASLDEQGCEWLDLIESSGKRLTGMIHNLLEYAKAGKGDSIRLRPVALDSVMRSLERNLNDLVRETGAALDFGELPLVNGDEIQLSQVLQNLITNAIKYRKNDVAPRVRVTAGSTDTHWIINVSDNGTGVDASQRQRIFKAFVRGTTQSDGSGIGLAICRRIVERHGGEIWVESVPGEGSTFSFSLLKNLEHLR
jgi:signal transduction histidine kinase